MKLVGIRRRIVHPLDCIGAEECFKCNTFDCGVPSLKNNVTYDFVRPVRVIILTDSQDPLGRLSVIRHVPFAAAPASRIDVINAPGSALRINAVPTSAIA